MRTGKPAARGFTLLEVMLAFVLLAVAMGTIVGMLSRGLNQVQRSEGASEATLYAQSFLDQLGVLEPLRPGQRQGEFGDRRYRYRLNIREVPDPAPRVASEVPVEPVQAANMPKLYRVELLVSWGRETADQRLRLVALRARASGLATGESP